MKRRKNNRRRLTVLCRFFKGVGGLSAFFLFLSCSTTKNLPEGEVLYTGIEKIEVMQPDNTVEGNAALQEVEAALSFPPNNSLFGSSTQRIPLPLGLWIYNGFKKYKSGVGKWIFNKFAAKPVFIRAVNPDVRVAVSHNLLRENGYFNGSARYEIIPDKKDSLKAKIHYYVEMNQGYRYDSIQYMRMRHFADTLIHAHAHEQLLRKEDQFNVIQMENERQRISSLLRNKGFYYYRPEFITYEADTLLTPGKVWLQVKRKEGTPANALRPYRIGNISVYMNGYNNEKPTDSLRYKDITIYYEGKLKIRPAVLYGRLRFKPGDLYTFAEQQRTQTGLSRLGVFRYAEFQYTPQPTVLDSVRQHWTNRNRNEAGGPVLLDSLRRQSMIYNQDHLLDVRINSVYDLPYDGEFEMNAATKNNNYAGPGVIFSVNKRNAFRGGEVLGFQVKGSYEWQTGKREGGGSKMNSYEVGASSTLTIPFLLFPGYIYRDLVQPSSTTFKLSVDLLNRAKYFRMTSFGMHMTYDFRPTPTTRHSVTPFRLNFNKMRGTALYDTLALKTPTLRLSLQNQFIPAMAYTFTYDNTGVSTRNYFSWSASFTQAGNIMGAVSALAGKDFHQKDKKLFGNPFTQFVKGTTEFRYNYRIDRKNRLVARLMGGAIYSYGNALVAPYNEQFFIGGANSVRAFTIRSIGPGRYDPVRNEKGDYLDSYAYLDRNGDLKLEANLEYRFNIVGNLHGALFLDSGGIWTIRKDEREGTQLKKGEFFNDLALGTGAGLRYDLSFLLIRLDVGLGLHVPYETHRKGYFNINPFKDNGGYSWHLAVGYPF